MQPEQLIEKLFQAAESGDSSSLQELVETQPEFANTENKDGLTLLGYAAHFGNADAVKVLLDHGADVNAISHSTISFIPSNTALHAAIAGERNLDVINLLLHNQADPNIRDSNDQTCLQVAAFHVDSIELIQILIDYGADVHAKSATGQTALSIALEQGNEKVVALLKEY
ncbi:ankyrin repeat domain-containing protein [Brevibacillus daliensis]|uniref:ankyrin repeat domain-containing protein n=1 Tax=Brevibacillus daliensis TaxID=2892995 RepID=UPI001E2B896B|nr:ankyrin repeat domain-containing protein [Brevibacillus daliensis]